MSTDCSTELSAAHMRENIAKAHAHWHNRCFACSSQNSCGLRLEFSVTDRGVVEALFPCDAFFRGFSDYLHGGISAALLDAAMTNCLFAHGFVGLTGELNIRFHEPIALKHPVCVRAWLQYTCHRLHVFQSEIEQEGTVKVKGVGKFLEKEIDNDRPGGCYGWDPVS